MKEKCVANCGALFQSRTGESSMACRKEKRKSFDRNMLWILAQLGTGLAKGMALERNRPTTRSGRQRRRTSNVSYGLQDAW
jgi:hypothetical protein